MTNVQDQYEETPYYESLTYQQNNTTPVQQPIQVNQPNNSYGSNATNKTPCNPEGFFPILLLISDILIMFYFICDVISNGNVNSDLIIVFTLGGIIFILVSCFLGRVLPFYSSINISSTFGTITILNKKIFGWFDKKIIIQINDIQEVIVQSKNLGKKNYFYVIFKLSDGREVKDFPGVINKKGEGKKVFQIIRNALPQRIAFSGNLVN